MELKEILSIAGAPGLYKYIAQGKGGIIVESLVDSRRTMVSGSAKVSALGDIAIFTDADEVPLAEIFQSIFDKNRGVIAVTNKSSNKELHNFMAQTLPTYDRDRVHTSDIKKLATWYNMLVGAGMTSFKIDEEAKNEESEPVVTATKPKAEKAASATAKKQAVKSATPKATGSHPKVTTPRSTTNRKSGN